MEIFGVYRDVEWSTRMGIPVDGVIERMPNSKVGCRANHRPKVVREGITTAVENFEGFVNLTRHPIGSVGEGKVFGYLQNS